MAPEAWASVKRVLAVRLDNIGDVIMLGPSLRCLREALPDAEITLLASPAGAQVAPLLPWIDDVIVHRAVWQDVGGNPNPEPARHHELVGMLKQRPFDAALIFTSFSQSPHPPGYACYLAGIPIRMGQSKEFGGAILSQEVKPLPDETHQVDRNLFLLESAGFPVSDRELFLDIPKDAQKRADGMLAQEGIDPLSPFVVMAPGASCAARRYDLVRAALVMKRLPWRTGLPVAVVGSARETELFDSFLRNGEEDVVSLVGQTSIPELAAVIKRAALVIANNSGPMHIADAVRTPMVVLYSGTEYESQWRPRSAEAVLLNRPVPCSPCYNFTCPYNMECLDIPPEEIISAVLRLLAVPAGGSAKTATANTLLRHPEIRYEQENSFNQ